MDSAQKAAFVIAQAALLNAEIAGMTAENQAAVALGEVPPFDLRKFREVAVRYEGVLGFNAMITFFGEN